MSSKTISASKDAGARHTAGGSGSGTWNGHEEHLICGLVGSQEYRSFVRFNVAWKSWNVRTLTSATLKLYRDKDHSAATTASNLKVQNMGKDWGETKYGSESSWSSSPGYNWDNRAAYGSGARRTGTTLTEAVGTPDGNQYVEDTVDVTSLVMKWAPSNIVDASGNTGKGLSNYGFILYNSDEATANKCLEFCSRETPDGAGYYPQLTLVYDESAAPTAPVNLSPSGGQGVEGVPRFKGSLADVNEYDELSAVRVKVYHNSAGTSLKWDSGVKAKTGADFWVKAGVSNWKIGKTFYWKAKTKDNSGLWGPYSALQSFAATTLPSAPTGLLPEAGQTSINTPVFSGTSKANDPGEYIENAQVNVYEDEGQTTVQWASGDVATGTTNRSFSVTYAGGGLTADTVYYWKARAKDNSGGYSPWSQLRTFRTSTTGSVYGLYTGKADTLTPTLTATTSTTMNAHQYIITNAAGVEHSDTGTVGDSGTAISSVYSGTALTWGKKWYFKCRYKNLSEVWSDYVTSPFWTNASPAAQQTSPASGATVVVPELRSVFSDADVALGFDDEPSAYEVVSNSVTYIRDTNADLSAASNMIFPHYWLDDMEGDVLERVQVDYGTASADTVTYDTGLQSLEIDSPGDLSSETIIATWYPGGDKNAQRYVWDFSGRESDEDLFSIRTQRSTATNWTASRIQFTDTAGNYSRFTLTPSTGSFGTLNLNRDDTPSSTSGTLDWSSVASISFVLQTSGSYTGTINLDSMKSCASATTPLSYDTAYTWTAEYTDDSGAANAQGSVSAAQTFFISRLPVVKTLVVQASDLTFDEIDNPEPTLTWTFAGSDSKTQTHAQVQVVHDPGQQSEEIVFDSGMTSRTSGSFKMPTGILTHEETYDFVVTVQDRDGLTGIATIEYFVSWTPPADLTPVTTTADEFNGTIMVEWPQSVLDAADFARYEVKRYDGITWELLAQITDQTVTEYYDYGAGYGVTYTYKVTQFENVSGSNPVESIGADQPEVSVSIDDWSIVVPDRDDLLIVLYLKKDKHVPEVQEEIFRPWGRDSKVFQRSGIMGNTGTLTVIVPSDEADAFKSKTTEIIALGIPVYIKSPFGDSWKSYISPPTIAYLSGGHIDSTIKYTEVN